MIMVLGQISAIPEEVREAALWMEPKDGHWIVVSFFH